MNKNNIIQHKGNLYSYVRSENNSFLVIKSRPTFDKGQPKILVEELRRAEGVSTIKQLEKLIKADQYSMFTEI